jgi:hypothetical protein
MWAKGTGLTDEQAARALPVTGSMTLGLFWGLGATGGGLAALGMLLGAVTGKVELAAIFGAFGTSLALPGVLVPGPFFRSLHKKPLRSAEIESLLAAPAGQNSELERAYLNLVLTAVRRPAAASGVPEAETEVRDALRALGEAIDRLPLDSSGGGQVVDAATLRRESAAVIEQANREPDDVIADSLRRRAEALARSADAAERSSLVLRRTAALKSELLAQTEALRLGLAAFDAGAGMFASTAAWGAGADLSRLAESVRDVAREAQNAAVARNELDGIVPTAAENATPPLQTVGGVAAR